MDLTPPVRFPGRPRDAHKTSVGTVLVVAGARGMVGAALLTGEAALRAGAGLVTVASPASVQRALEVKTTCLITHPLPETPRGALARAALDEVLALAAGKGAVAVGPGLSRDDDAVEVVRGLVAALPGDTRVVLDADGLNAFEGRADDLRPLAGRAVLTPHPGEFARLAGRRVGPDERRPALEAFVARAGVTTLLKGAGTLVCDPRPGGGLRTYENPTGNPGMATAGAGDVLTGVIAALLAAGLAPFDAARLGAWLHGRAGDLVARRTGWAPMIATDLVDGLVEAIRNVETRA
ncbi:MAG: NAD(P)H-hydrate dehydratase [Planctomycetes bacterium]|nr:NAD(P)H-hydrate dehydratase [Planctomycetota bacterium]